MRSNLGEILVITERIKSIIDEFGSNHWEEQAKKAFTADIIKRNYAFLRLAERETGKSIDGSVVLDAGCGMGNISILMALLGARKVYGVEMDRDRLTPILSILDEIKRLAPNLNSLEYVHANVLEYHPQEKIDLCCCREMLSHLWDRKAFYQKASSILADGGVLFASDGNNGANPKLVAYNYNLWKAAEQNDGRIYNSRLRFIQKSFPSITDNNRLQYLAANTCYMKPEEIQRNVEAYLATGKLEVESPFQPDKAPWDPDYAFFPCEDILYPEVEKVTIREAGLSPRINPYFLGAGRHYLYPLNRLIRMVGGERTLPYARGILIMVHKPA